MLDGSVDFSNPQGSVTVAAGEAATATFGEAPSKVVVINRDDQEQMLLNMSLHGAFETLTTLGSDGPALRAAAVRLGATPPGEWSSEDRVLAAELALEREGRAAALAAVAAARQGPLTAEQEARLTLVEAVVAGSEERYAEAAQLFERARPGLRGEQAAAALYQGYFARSLADPSRNLPPPAVGGAGRAAVIGRAIVAAFVDGPQAAFAIMEAAAPRFGDDGGFQAAFAQVALLVGNDDVARAAAARAMALTPEDAEALWARARVRAGLDHDLDGALADLERAIALTPASPDLWNDLGLLQDERGASREAEAAFRRAIALDPRDPVAHANYAVLLLDMNRVAEADAEIAAAVAADPSFDIVWLAEGRLKLQQGDRAGAIDDLLRATTANPAYSNAMLLLAIAHADEGAWTLAEQAADNAARLDPNDPVVSQVRSSFATFLYRADDAIRYAQDSVRQTQARGGDYRSIAASRDFGSTLGTAYRTLSLGAWGDYWADAVFSPFDAGGYFDRSIAGGQSPLLTARTPTLPGPDPVPGAASFSDLLQGLLLDPLALVGPELRPAVVRTPFTEVAIGGGPDASGGDGGYNLSGGLQRLANAPVPYALLLSGDYRRFDPSYADQPETGFTGLVGFGLQPTANDRVVGFGNFGQATGGLAFEGVPDTKLDRSDAEGVSGFVGWSHTFGYRNVVNLAVSASRLSSDVTVLLPFPVSGALNIDGSQTTVKVGVSQMLGLGPVTLRLGAEGGRLDGQSTLNLDTISGSATLTSEASQSLGRAWVDVLGAIGDDVQVEAALFGTYLEDAPEETVLAPRVGIAWAPRDGHWLRAGYLRQRPALESDTLAPIGLLGLDPIEMPSDTGQVDTTLARWDAQWTPRFFTAIEYQHQAIDDLSITFARGLDPLVATHATLDQVQASANLWMEGGFGAFGSVARNWSQADLESGQGAIPFLPDVSARFGVTHVNPRRFAVTLAESYLGQREALVPDTPLEAVWATDLTGSWESPNRHVSLSAGIYNLFDADYEILPTVRGVGRTLTATLTARF